MDDDTIANAEAYCARNGLRLLERLGTGIHGIVFTVEGNTEFATAALKVHYSPEPSFRERSVYERLKEMEVTEIRGFEVPQLLHFDDELMAIKMTIKMTIVTPPFVLDFAGAYLDFAPKFSDEIWEDWARKNEEQFGADWFIAQTIIDDLKDLGIHMHDPSPSNIRFR